MNPLCHNVIQSGCSLGYLSLISLNQGGILHLIRVEIFVLDEMHNQYSCPRFSEHIGDLVAASSSSLPSVFSESITRLLPNQSVAVPGTSSVVVYYDT
jgi:hypothetical protein